MSRKARVSLLCPLFPVPLFSASRSHAGVSEPMIYDCCDPFGKTRVVCVLG